MPKIYLNSEDQIHLTSWQLAVILPKLGLEDAQSGEIPPEFLSTVIQKLNIYLNEPHPPIDPTTLVPLRQLAYKAAQLKQPLHWSR